MIAAGFKYLHFGQVNTLGYLIGGMELAVAGDDPVSLLRLEGAQTAPLSIADDEIITVLGDDEPLVTFDFEAATLPNGVVEMANRNVDFEALAQGTKVQVDGFLTLGALQPKGADKTPLMMLAQRRAKTWEAGNRGGAAWEALFALGTRVRPLFAQIQQRTHTPYRYFVNASKVSRKPWGEPFTVTDNGTDAMPLFTLDLDNPIMLEPAIGDGVQDTFVLNHTPLNGSASVQVYVDGVKQVLTTAWTYAEAYRVATITFTGGHIPDEDSFIVFVLEVDESELEVA